MLKNILLIDDDSINNFIVINKLKRSGLVENILSKENGEEALNYLYECIQETETQLPELIFLDINMPILDGWGFLDAFIKFDKKYKDQIHIYMLSSSVYNEDIVQSKQYECIKSFISKPLSNQTLAEIIQLRMRSA